MFFLFETHVIKERQKLFEIYFKNYTILWVPATKIHNVGRASGGCLFGYRKSIQKQFNFKFQTLFDNIVLYARIDNKPFYFIPKYLNCNNWRNDFYLLENLMDSLNPSNFCIVGDLNARIADFQVIDSHFLINSPCISSIRVSQDKVMNDEGRRLKELIENIGGVILNGRTINDTEGSYTYLSNRGNSVIDYCICSVNFLKNINHFAIKSKPFSDHLPLCLEFKSSNVCAPAELSSSKLYWNISYAQKYSDNLISLQSFVDPQAELSTNVLVDSIVEKIKKAYVFNKNKQFFAASQKWFDCQCARAKKRVTLALKSYRKSLVYADKIRYLRARSNYRSLCQKKKISFYNKTLNSLNAVKNSSDWWRLSRSLKNQSFTPTSPLNSDDFFEYFSGKLQSSPNVVQISWCMPYSVNPILDSPIESLELYSVLNNLKNNKAPGPDGITYEFYKNIPPCFYNELLNTLNKIFLSEEIPSNFNKAIMIPLFKKGDPLIASNYRGLSLLNSLSKIFNSIILNRLTFWIEHNKILTEFQAGFRKQYSTVDNIFNLMNIVQLNSLNSKKTFAFFVDFSNAFDTIPHSSLFFKLSKVGISSKIIRILQNTYEKSETVIFDGSTYSSPFSAKVGVKQGCILSPLLFSLFINDLVDELSGGVNVAGINVKVLLYADDIVILSDSPYALQSMIDDLQTYCLKWSLCANLDKSKVMIFRTGSRIPSNLRFNFGESSLEIVNSYKYLGIVLTYNLSIKKHLSSKLSSAKLAINSQWSKFLNHPKISKENKLKIFNAASLSIMLYSAEVWGYRKYDECEKLIRFFLKKLIYLPTCTPSYMLQLESGLDSLFSTSLKLHFNYIRKVLQMNNDRLPFILSNHIITNKILWSKDRSNLLQSLNLPQNNSDYSYEFCKQIIIKINQSEKEDNIHKALNSSHDLYSKLNYSNFPSVVGDFLSWPTSLITKARCGLLPLNGRSFLQLSNKLCTICNCKAVENTLHFIGQCPVYKSYRLFYFGKSSLNEFEVITILNGSNLFSLYKYLEVCLNYRNLIISEFN